ncbi:MAG TPA: glycosyl hydrolase, partial [Chthoniobacteraceae bacterium]|nr:glycosyl hydrolase [Chthoniobacteraceae bacterium]
SAWMSRFMPEAKRRGLRIDFVCLHRYPDISNPKAVDQVEAMLREAYDRYGLPVWLTECGAADVSLWHQPQVSRPTPEMAEDFVIRLLAMLERLPFVERYAWFADRVAKAYRLGTLFEMYGAKITTLGEVYRDNA